MKEHILEIKQFLICLFISLVLGSGIIYTSNANLQFINTVCLWCFGILYLAIIMYWVLWKKCFQKFRGIHKAGRKVITILLSVIIVALAFVCLPFSIENVTRSNYLQKEMLGKSNIVITALGEKNERSKGYDVWIEGIKVDKSDYNLYEIGLENGWDWKDGRPFYNKKELSSISFTLYAKDNYTLLTRKGPSMGKIKVQIGKISSVYDLYSEKTDDRYKLNLGQMVNDDNLYSKGNKLLYNICYITILWILSFIVSINVLSFALRERKLKFMEENNDSKNQ